MQPSDVNIKFSDILWLITEVAYWLLYEKQIAPEKNEQKETQMNSVDYTSV